MKLIKRYQKGDPIIQLPEVEHTFNASDKKDLYNMQDYRSLFKYTTKEELQDRDRINRFLEVYNLAGRPLIVPRINGESESYFSPLNIINANNSYQAMIELPHALQHNKHIEDGDPDYLGHIKNIAGLAYSFITGNRRPAWSKSTYENPESREYKAHQVLEPAIFNYVNRGDSVQYQKILSNQQ